MTPSRHRATRKALPSMKECQIFSHRPSGKRLLMCLKIWQGWNSSAFVKGKQQHW
jgi:hypothetical protein